MSMQDDLDNEGAIDTGDDSQQNDNSGAAPVPPVPDDNSGAPPLVPAPTPGAPGAPASPGADGGPLNPMNVPGNMKRIISYLMGADASHPQTIDQAGAQVDPEGKLSPADRNILAIDAVREQGGDNAAWQLMQANRVAYNAQTAFAKTALTGTPQKPADLNAAIDAANKAQANVLDGSNVQFAPGRTGVTATVTMHGTSQPQVINLTPQQFSQFLDVGGDGQWDKIMDASAPATLQRIASSGGQQAAAPSQGGISKLSQMKPLQRPAPQQAPAAEEDTSPVPTPKTNFGSTPSTLNLSGDDNIREPEPDNTGIDDQLQARANKLFPNISQGAERNRFIASEMQRADELENKVDVATEKGKRALDVAVATGSGRVQAAEVTAKAKKEGWQYASDQKLKAAQAQLAQKVVQMENSNANAAQTRALKAIQTKLMSAQTLTPQEQAYLDTLPGAAQGGAQTTAPGQRPAPQPQAQAPHSPQQPPVQGAKLYKGQWYTRGPNGESVPYGQ